MLVLVSWLLNIIGTLNIRILASILLTYIDNLLLNHMYLISSDTKPLTLKPNSGQKIQLTVSLNINVMPPNLCDISTSLKE